MYGATQAEWFHWQIMLGLTDDLLPVVSNPNIPIAPASSLKSIGKTPSIINNNKVYGMKNWTSKTTTDSDITVWSSNPDLGICLQTRAVKAIDIDIDDPGLAQEIVTAINYVIPHLPCRVRSSSGKRLVLLSLSGDDFSKRSFKVKDSGIVELLSTGQQCVVAGTHTSGVKYEWVGGLPLDIPIVSRDDLDIVWEQLAKEFGDGTWNQRRLGSGSNDQAVGGTANTDEVASWLASNWPTFGEKNGKLFVECPWKFGHSSDSGETEASWLIAMTGGYSRGHFNCLHASCAGRSDQDFLDIIGYSASEFGVSVPYKAPYSDAAEASSDAGKFDPRVYKYPSMIELIRDEPNLARDRKGYISFNLTNCTTALNSPLWFGWYIAYDEFVEKVLVCPVNRAGMWQPVTDDIITRFRTTLEMRGFDSVPKADVCDCINSVALSHTFDSAVAWLKSIKWDGKPRIASFCERALGTPSTPYSRAVGQYWWSALAARVMDAGCQVDMAPILTGAQGLGKSSLLKTMLPSDQYYCSISFKQIDKEAAVIMQGKIIGEFAELKGFSTSAMEDIKDFITRRTEEWRKPYDRCTSTYKRRIVFAGTTNENEFLDDPTGNRRWLPISIGVMDLAWVKDNRDQLWAEGLVAWSENNCTPLWEDVTRLAKDVHQNYHTSDAWQEKIARWVFEDNLSGTPAVVGFSITDMAWQALGIETRNIDRKVEIRLKRIITRLKFEPKHVGGVVKWYYNENG